MKRFTSHSLNLLLKIGLALAILAVLAIVSSPELIKPSYNSQNDKQAVARYKHTVKVCADSNYPPYSYLDKNGEPTGFLVEIMYALAKEMKVNIDLDMTSWDKALSDVLSGRRDIILGCDTNPERAKVLSFTMPLTSDPYVAFYHDESNTMSRNFNKKSLAVMGSDIVIHRYLEPQGLLKNCVIYNSNTDCFKALKNNEVDYVICCYRSGMEHLKSLGIPKHVLPLNKLCFINLCIATNKKQSVTQSKLEEALGIIFDNNTIQEMSDKWLLPYSTEDSWYGELFQKDVNPWWSLLLAALCATLGFVLGRES